MVVYNGGVALDNSVHGEVAAVSCVRDFPVFERFDGRLDGIDRRPAVLQDQHGQLRSTRMLSALMPPHTRSHDVLVASFQVDLLVLVTVITRAGVHVDAAHVIVGRTTRCLARVRVD